MGSLAGTRDGSRFDVPGSHSGSTRHPNQECHVSLGCIPSATILHLAWWRARGPQLAMTSIPTNHPLVLSHYAIHHRSISPILPDRNSPTFSHNCGSVVTSTDVRHTTWELHHCHTLVDRAKAERERHHGISRCFFHTAWLVSRIDKYSMC